MPKDSIFNILDTVYTGYKKLFPNGTIDQFETYVKRTFPNQVKYLNNFKTKLTDYAVGSIDDLKDTGNQVKQQAQQQAKQVQQNIQRNVNTAKQVVNNVQSKAQARLDQALTANGLKQVASKSPSLASKAGNIVKSGVKTGAKAAGGIVAGALDIPQTVGDWTREGANAITRGLDVVGNALTVGAPYAARVPGWRGKALAGGMVLGGMGLHTASDMLQGKNNSQQDLYNPVWDTIENPLLKVTDEEKQRYFDYVNNEANQLQQQAQQGIQQSQEAIDFYNNASNRIANEYNAALNEVANTNMSLPPVPRTGLNFSSGTNTSPINLTPINGAPTSANNNQQIITNQGNNQMVNQQPTTYGNPSVLDNINMFNSYIGGVQQGNRLPNLGVSPEELQAYTNMMEQMGRNVGGFRTDIDAYREALARNNRMQTIGGVLNGIGQVASGFLPGQSTETAVPGLGYIRGRDYQGANLNGIGDSLVNASNRQLENLRTNLELNNQLRQQEQAQAAQFADLLAAARVSNATGLPMNVVRSMEPGDYLTYIAPIQEAQNRAQELGIQGTADLLTGRQQQLADYARALDTQRLSNLGSANVANINQTGGYNREYLAQNAANLRAQLEAMKDIRVAQLNNQTRIELMRMTGLNARQLEQLRQEDPNAYLRAVGNILMATSYSPGNPQARQVENILYNDVYSRIRPTATNNTQEANQSYWAQFNR